MALATAPPALVFLAIMINIGLPGWIFGVVLLPLPIAIAVAILNHGLYDFRRAAHRTLVWLTMSAAVAGIYAAAVIIVAALAPDHHTWWPSLPAAALAALVLIPLRDKLQHGVTRVVYGRWHEPYEVLAGLGSGWRPPPTSTGCWRLSSPSSPPGWTCAASVRGLDGTVVTGIRNTVLGTATDPSRALALVSPAFRCWPMASRSAP